MLQVHNYRDEFISILPRNAVGAEVGVFTGRFSRELCKRTSPRLFYAIDPWWERHGPTFSFRPKMHTRHAYHSTLKRLRPWIKAGIAQVLVQKSQEALQALSPGTLDWVYLDSSHEEAETLEELHLCSKAVRPEGVISGHDFTCKKWPGVFRALTRFLHERPEYELFYVDNFSNWAMRRHGQGDRIQEPSAETSRPDKLFESQV